jgi:uncharacterized protein
MRRGKRIGFEFKYTDAPTVTKSMKIAIKNLKLSALKIIYPGNDVFPLDRHIEAVSLQPLTQPKL